MVIADEKNLLDHLPRFAAEDLSRIPFINTDSMYVSNMARKLEGLEQRMLNLEMLLAKSHSQEAAGDMSTSDTDGARGDNDENSGSSYLSPANSAEEEVTTDSEWTTVVRRKNNNTRSAQLPESSRSVRTVPGTRTDKPRARHTVIGTRSEEEGTSLKTGVEIVQKSVVHVDNLGPDCTEALLKDYLLAADISVISCFKAKSWLRDNEKDLVTAFRVCVPAKQLYMIFKADLWNRGTIIRDWRFKGKQNGHTQ